MSQRPPEAALWDALRGGLVTRALGLVAELDIARLLGEEARPVAELAAASGADPDTLQRLLRALASDGVFAEEAVKHLLRNPEDAAKLVRQSAYWTQVKNRQFPGSS